MSWVKGARTEFLPNLKIADDTVVWIEFLTEPEEINFGKKKTLKGNEIDDVRYHANVKYLQGNGRGKVKNEDSFPAKIGELYTLWLPTSLIGKILGITKYSGTGDAPKLAGTKWKIWRSLEKRGGNRLYDAALVTEVPSTAPSITEATPPAVDLDSLALQLAGFLKPLGELDTGTWKQYCTARKVDCDAITKKMQELKLIEVSNLKIKYTG